MSLSRISAATAVLLASLTTGCSASSVSPPAPASAAPTQLVVFAAASMKTTFTQLVQVFESTHGGVSVTVNYAGSQALVEQIGQGAPADVLATADESTMGRAVTQGLVVGTPVVFASNRLTIVVPPDNPARITSFADLTKPVLALVVCAPAVPCGAATVKVAKAAGVSLTPVSEEQAVTDVLAKVQAGEADAGLVYVTDAASAGDTVKSIDFPESDASINKNPICVVASAAQPGPAKEFVDLVTSTQGQGILAAAGFGAP